MDLNKDLMSKLLDLDDVDAVYTDQKWIKLCLVLLLMDFLSSYAAEPEGLLGIYLMTRSWIAAQ